MNSKIQIFILSVLMFALSSCKENSDRGFQEVKALNNRSTSFVPTLENKIESNKNIVYVATMLYAWEDLKKKLNSKVKLNEENSDDLKLLNSSQSHLNSMLPDEYSVSTEVNDGIETRAYFKKSLPFENKFQKINDVLIFNNTKVLAFGMTYLNEIVTSATKILYYKNDDEFIIKITPKDTNQAIILTKGLDMKGTFRTVLEQVENLEKQGNKEKADPNQQWKYIFNNEDQLVIPVLDFNLETNYKSLERQQFSADRKRTIVTAYQRNAFILDENGAEIESEVTYGTDSIGPVPVKIIPKKLIFDKPFVLFLKRKESKFPYFALKVENADLMRKRTK